MSEQKLKQQQKIRRVARTRSQVLGTPERPRLSVNISHKNVIAQIINDAEGKTLAYASTVSAKVGGSLKVKAEWVGAEIGKAAAKAKVKQVVFDRGGRKYHGRMDALAAAARKSGLEF